MVHMTKLVLLLGFLGSGKTTLMHKILDRYSGSKIGILVNDFGKLNVDSILLERNGIPMQELSNGSIFCACIKANFYDSLVEMSKDGLEYLFIEASGLVDPTSMPDILEAISSRVHTPYNFVGSVCVIDAKYFLKQENIFPAVNNQVDYANTIIINKSDLVDEAGLNSVKEKAREINPRADIVCASHCEVNIYPIIEGLKFSRDINRESTNTYESRPKSLMIEGYETYNKDDIATLVENLSPHAFRIKGFVKTGEGAIEVHAVGTSIDIKPWDGKIEISQLVVISSVGLGIISIVTNALKDFTPQLKMIM